MTRGSWIDRYGEWFMIACIVVAVGCYVMAWTEARRFQALVSAAHLAVVYSDHPDYCEEWKP